jgi:DNA-binding winged helix-turn-helix (wHTH) protein/TolB-like protein
MPDEASSCSHGPVLMPPRVARFGVFEFDLDTLELRRQGVRMPIEPQPARALALLLLSAGEIVSRDALKQALWKGDVHVDFDRGLAYVMSQVRNALGDSADNPRFIETLPKRGFRFIAPAFAPDGATAGKPTFAADGAAADTRSASHARSIYGVAALAVTAAAIAAVVIALSGQRPILAVAIFDNETGQAQYDRFTASMADAVIGRLATLDVNRMGVVGNARSLRMPRSERDLTQIKSETGASFILISVLQSREAGISLLTQLISLDDGTHVWVKRFDRAGGNLDGLETEVLNEVEKGVRLRVIDGVPKPTPSSSPSASR